MQFPDLDYGSSTHVGLVRRANEDAHLASPPVFLVADGMGGHAHGRQASEAVVAAFAELAGAEACSPTELLDAIERAAVKVRALGAGEPAAPPGSTVTGIALAEQDGAPCWLVFNVGDSRVYRWLRGDLEQITVDHSRVQELVDAGELTRSAARNSQERNVITRALGGGSTTTPVVDQWLLLAQPGEWLVVCSDGLTGDVSDALIQATIAGESSAQAAADRLVQAALAAGGHDNVTVIVVRTVTDESEEPAESTLADGALEIDEDTHADDPWSPSISAEEVD